MQESGAGAALARRWKFERVEFDERSLTLSVDERAVEVERKPLELLRHLLQRAGDVVTKDALIRAVWPGRVVSDAALAKSMARLREALGDRDQLFIKTHHGYGYRLVAPFSIALTEPIPAKRVRARPGSAVADALPEIAPSASQRAEAEHRPLTVLFCDLVGSTQLSESLDPEAFRDLLFDYRRRAADICRRYEGQLTQQFGDGLLMVFGFPAAHDDDAERALRCGCDLLAAFGASEHRPQLSLRIGVHTGSLVIGQNSIGGEVLATGTGLHLAARLQDLAEPNTILVSDATFRLVPGLFVTRDFGAQDIRGLSEPVRVHQVIQPSGVRSRLEAAATHTPFVGREREVGRLDECWPKAIDGCGQAILFSGEPGIGKSRLLLMARERLAGSAHTWLECRAAALNRDSAYQPLLELLHRGLAIRDGDTDAQKIQRLEQGLAALDMDGGQTLPLLAPLLNLPLPEGYAPPLLGAELKRRLTLDALTQWILRLAHQQPLVIAFEDLHWADDFSLDVLDRLVEQLYDRPILLLMTARTEFVPRWTAGPHLHALALDPLPDTEVARMLGSLLPDAALSAGLRTLIHERAGGVPLFVEELSRALLESGAGQAALDHQALQRAIPDSLQGLLMARLDRLGAARELIQIAAVIGREVPQRLFAVVAGLDESVLRQNLHALIAGGFLHLRGAAPEASYVFKHALIQDAAYDTLLKSARQRWHGRVAEALEQHFPERARSEPAALAGHYERAGRPETAARWCKIAADAAFAVVPLDGATHHTEHGLRLLASVPASPSRDLLEVELRLCLARNRSWRFGLTSDTVEDALSGILELCRKLGKPEVLSPALSLVWHLQVTRGPVAPGLALSQELLDLGDHSNLDPVRACGFFLRCWAHWMSGQFAVARYSGEQALRLNTPEVAMVASRMAGFDMTPATMVPLASTLWNLGYPDQAERMLAQVDASADASGNPFTMAWAYSLSSLSLAVYQRRSQKALALADKAIALSARYGLHEWLSFAQQWRGLALCQSGAVVEGLEQLRESDAGLRKGQTLAYGSLFAAHKADACLRAGWDAEARAAVRAGFAHVLRFDEHYWDAELHRVQGELQLRGDAPDPVAAQASFEQALAVARDQQAKSFELRAAISLARLCQGQHRVAEARELLGSVYAWFTEGFDTPDLQEAAMLLAELEQRGT